MSTSMMKLTASVQVRENDSPLEGFSNSALSFAGGAVTVQDASKAYFDALKTFGSFAAKEELQKVSVEELLSKPFSTIRADDGKTVWVAPKLSEVRKNPGLELMVVMARLAGYHIVECKGEVKVASPTIKATTYRLKCQLVASVLTSGQLSAKVVKDMGRKDDLGFLCNIFRDQIVQMAQEMNVDSALFRGHSCALSTGLSTEWKIGGLGSVFIDREMNTLFNKVRKAVKASPDLLLDVSQLKSQFMSREPDWENKGLFLPAEREYFEDVYRKRLDEIRSRVAPGATPEEVNAAIKEWRAVMKEIDRLLAVTIERRTAVLFKRKTGKRKKSLTLKEKLALMTYPEFTATMDPVYIRSRDVAFPGLGSDDVEVYCRNVTDISIKTLVSAFLDLSADLFSEV